MPPITSADFRSQNQILFSAPIVHFRGKGLESYGDGDYIDFNHNGHADYDNVQDIPFLTGAHYYMEEPRLSIPLKELSRLASLTNTGEVLTGSKMPTAQSVEMNFDTELDPYESVREARSLEPRALVGRYDTDEASLEAVLHFAPNAAGAIDLHTQEYLIYTPKPPVSAQP